MQTLKFAVDATGNNKARFTFQKSARIKSIRWQVQGDFAAAATPEFSAEISRSAAADFASNSLLSDQSIDTLVGGFNATIEAAANMAFSAKQQTMLDASVAINETLFVNVDTNAAAFQLLIFVDFN